MRKDQKLIGFIENKVHIFVFNYLLSDAVSFLSSALKQRLIEDIGIFIIDNNVKNVFFYDINYYGDAQKLNSCTQLMVLLIQKLRERNKQLKILYACILHNSMRGNEDWIFYSKNELLLKNLMIIYSQKISSVTSLSKYLCTYNGTICCSSYRYTCIL